MQSAYTVESALKSAIVQLQEGDNTSPSIDAAVLLCHALDKPRSYLLTWPEKHLTSEQESEFHTLLKRRLTGEPVAYIVGEREFWSLPLKVSPSTLIPRPDTERLVEVALDKTYGKQGAILDLGTGTGAIALALLLPVLQQVVLKQLPLGIGITVLSTAPVMALLVAAPEGDHPRAAGVCASLLAVSGIALAVLA